MLRNPNHIQGAGGIVVPGTLNLGQFMLEKMWHYRDNVAFIDASTDQSITYKEIASEAMNFAISLTHMGVRGGDVVALMSENRFSWLSAVLGAICTGAAFAAVSPTYMKEELNNAIKIAKPKIFVCSPTAYKNHSKILKSQSIEQIIIFGNERIEGTLLFSDLAINVARPVSFHEFTCADVNGQTDTVFIVYSSGTTGLPKGVMLTHLNVITACCLPTTYANPKEKTLSISPWYHVMGLVGIAAGSTLGRSMVYLPKFDVDLYLRTIEKYKIRYLSVVPPVLVAVSKWPKQYDLSSVEVVYSGAAPLHKDTADAVSKKFPNVKAVLQGYGASETTLGVIKFSTLNMEMGLLKTGSVGTVVPGTTVKIADLETGLALGAGRRGEVCVKGPMIMKGYVGIARGHEFDHEGFYKTGDIAYYDEDGYFYVVDRLKELIKYKGFQVPPAELEALLLTHPAVKDAGVIGVPHESGGEVPLAYVVGTAGEGELQAFVAERLSNPKHLRGGVRFLDQIPKSASGKILRKELRKLYNNSKSKL